MTNISDDLQLALLDTGLTTEQIEAVEKTVMESSMIMVEHMTRRFLEQGLTFAQMALIMKTMFGFISESGRLDQAKEDISQVFPSTE